MINFFRKINHKRFGYFLLSFFLISINISYSQNSKIDSLKSIISKGKKDTTQVNALNKLSIELTGIDSLSIIEATKYADQAMTLADELGYQKGKAYGHKNKGLIAYYQGNYREVAINWNESLEIFETIQDNLGSANLTSNLGAIYYSQGSLSKALDYYLRSLSFSERLGDHLRIISVLLNIGGTYIEAKDYDKALTYYEQAEPYLATLNNIQLQSAYLWGLGDVYSKKGDHTKALEYFNDALAINKDSPYYAYILRMIGKEERHLGNLQKAIDYFSLAYNTAEADDLVLDQIQTLLALGNTYQKTDVKKAIKAYQDAEPLALEHNIAEELRDIYHGMALAYDTLRDFKNAYVYQNKYFEVKDKVFNIESDEKINVLQFDFDLETKKVKEEIELLQKEATISELSTKRQKYIIYGTVGSLVVVFVLGIGVLNRYRYIKKTNKIIEEEKNRSENLLLNILPAEIAEELKLKGSADARNCELVSVLFTDFKEFTQTSERLTAKELIGEINECFEAFDHICGKYQIEKIKTIGDSYMAAGGIPLPMDNSVKNTILAALEMQSFITERISVKRIKNEIPFEMRLGINTGPVVAGIVGVKKFQYDVWGDTVNTASRMESNGEVGKVNISQHTYELIKHDSNFAFEKRGKIQVKGKGELEMYFVSLKNAA
jgi:class 3 adenylate cyclase/Tfp pilus assembly protein PilF